MFKQSQVSPLRSNNVELVLLKFAQREYPSGFCPELSVFENEQLLLCTDSLFKIRWVNYERAIIYRSMSEYQDDFLKNLHKSASTASAGTSVTGSRADYDSSLLAL